MDKPQVKVYDPHNKVEYDVDERIAPLLKRLWNVNMITWQCCGGHINDDGGYELPYIAFDFQKTYAPLAGGIYGYMKDARGYNVETYFLDKGNELIPHDGFNADICIIYGKIIYDGDDPVDTFPEFERDLSDLCNIHEPEVFQFRRRFHNE